VNPASATARDAPPTLHNQRVTLSYDGYGFAGFQAQDADKGRTIQEEVETALRKLHGDTFIRIEASGRTDQGVHALGQVISFRAPRAWAENELARALNSTLPKDIRAMASSSVPPDFHARRSAVSKRYRYLLDNCDTQHAVRRRYAGHTGFKLDRAVIDAVAALFLGRKDFASLRNAGTDVKTTIRTVTRSEVRWEESTMVFDVEADGFLRKMVRSMVGGLVEAGRGAVTVAQLQDALDAKDRSRWPKPATPQGLYLVEVRY
jgi:tRNA pseudouridine38-40 synthase